MDPRFMPDIQREVMRYLSKEDLWHQAQIETEPERADGPLAGAAHAELIRRKAHRRVYLPGLWELDTNNDTTFAPTTPAPSCTYPYPYLKASRCTILARETRRFVLKSVFMHNHTVTDISTGLADALTADDGGADTPRELEHLVIGHSFYVEPAALPKTVLRNVRKFSICLNFYRYRSCDDVLDRLELRSLTELRLPYLEETSWNLLPECKYLTRLEMERTDHPCSSLSQMTQLRVFYLHDLQTTATIELGTLSLLEKLSLGSLTAGVERVVLHPRAPLRHLHCVNNRERETVRFQYENYPQLTRLHVSHPVEPCRLRTLTRLRRLSLLCAFAIETFTNLTSLCLNEGPLMTRDLRGFLSLRELRIYDEGSIPEHLPSSLEKLEAFGFHNYHGLQDLTRLRKLTLLRRNQRWTDAADCVSLTHLTCLKYFSCPDPVSATILPRSLRRLSVITVRELSRLTNLERLTVQVLNLAALPHLPRLRAVATRRDTVDRAALLQASHDHRLEIIWI